MEPTTTHSVHRAPAWNQGGSSAPASANNPLAFFDLIMSTAQKMSAQGGDRNDVMGAMAPAEAPNQEPISSNGRSSQWQDDRHHDTQPKQEVSGSSSTTTEPEPAPEQDDPAAVAELSERPVTEDEEQPTPDDAALATAGAAGQETQLLGAPDPLQPAQDSAAAGETDQVDPTLAKQATPSRPGGDAAEHDTDVPLDTSAKSAEERAEGGADRPAVGDFDREVESASNKGNSNEKADKAAELKLADTAPQESDGEASIEVKAERETSRPISNESEPERGVSTSENESPSDNAGQRESNQEGERPESASRAKSNKPKPTIAEAAQADAAKTAQVAESAPAKNGGEVIAPAATAQATAPQASNAGGSATASEPGTTGITSLLQRGLQRGTLQKSTEGKPAAGLNTKQQVRLVNRVARAVETTPPGQAIRIRLNPSELGALKVEIKIENGNLTARIEAENPATRQVLLENLPQLRERLAESNIQVQQFEVDLMGQESPTDRDPSHLSDEASRRDEGRSSRERNQGSQGEADAEQDTSPGRRVNKEAERESRNLNVTI